MPGIERLYQSPEPLFMLGAAHSGKSEIAIQALDPEQQALVIGTADTRENSYGDRLDRLRGLRPEQWQSVENPSDLSGTIADGCDRYPQILVDSLNQWIANRIVALAENETTADVANQIERDVTELAKTVSTSPIKIVLVSSEVGAAPAPPRPVERLFRQQLGLANQALAAACPNVVLVTAGLPQILKQNGKLP